MNVPTLILFGLLALVVLAEGIVLFALIREITLMKLGLRNEILTPGGIKETLPGPVIGTQLLEIEAEHLDGRLEKLPMAKEKSTLLMFLSPNCHGCSSVFSPAQNISAQFEDEVDVILLSSGDRQSVKEAFGEQADADTQLLVDVSDLWTRMQIPGTPYSCFFDKTGTLLSQSMASSEKQLRTMIVLSLSDSNSRKNPTEGGKAINSALRIET